MNSCVERRQDPQAHFCTPFVKTLLVIALGLCLASPSWATFRLTGEVVEASVSGVQGSINWIPRNGLRCSAVFYSCLVELQESL